LAQNDSHNKLQNAGVSNKSGLEEESSKISFYLNASTTQERSIIDFNHKPEDNTSEDKNSIQTPDNYAMHKCKQQT
jgi:hypothetical protein